MFYEQAGRPRFPGKTVKEFVFEPSGASALPGWLTATGTTPVLAYGTTADRGALRLTTKSATPTSGDQAGVSTTSIDPTKYSEVGFFLSGLLCDSAALTDCTLGFQFSNGSTQGFYYQHDNATQETRLRVYPAAAIGSAAGVRWQYNKDNNGSGTNANAARAKDIGFVMRNNGDIFITAGDPYEGAGVLGYYAGTWPTTPQPVQFYILTRTAAQRYAEVTGIKLRLVQA